MFRGLFPPERIARLLGLDSVEARRTASPFENGLPLRDVPASRRMQLLEFEYYLSNQLLKDSDIMSMAHSLELRVPFLDHRLVETILKLPLEGWRPRRIPKRLLVEAMGPDFPREVWQRPKQGFTFPFQEWLKQDSGDLEEMALRNTPLEPRAVRDVWADYRAGRLHWSRPWATVVAAAHWPVGG
jgi:asparagine synthase (glutamine-hydrolysing)